MEWLLSILTSTVEYRDYVANGLSPSSMVSLVTFAVTLIQLWGAWKQGTTILEKRSGKSVSIVLTLYSTGFFFAFIVYGEWKNSLVMMVSGVIMGLTFLRTVVGLWRYETERFRVLEYLVGIVSLAFVAAMVFGEDKEWWLAVFLVGLVVAAFFQAGESYHAWRALDPGAIDPRFFITSMGANLFWFLYALYAVPDWLLQISNPASFGIYGSALYFWWRAKKAEKIWERVSRSQESGYMEPAEFRSAVEQG